MDEFEAEFDYVHNEGTVLTLRTNLDASRYRVVRVDLAAPERANWKTLVAEHESDVLHWATVVARKYLVLCYMRDVKVLLLFIAAIKWLNGLGI